MTSQTGLRIISVCLLLAVLGGAVLFWMYYTRDRVAVATYRLVVPEGSAIADLIPAEAELMRSPEVLQPVAEDLDLAERWKLDSDQEAIAHLKGKLTIKSGSYPDRVKVVYRDRSQKRALEILKALNRRFGALRLEAVERGELPPMAPLERSTLPRGMDPLDVPLE